jgi:hypothetical protein
MRPISFESGIQLFDFAVPWENKYASALVAAIRADNKSPVVKRFEQVGVDVPSEPMIPSYLNPFDMGRSC